LDFDLSHQRYKQQCPLSTSRLWYFLPKQLRW